MGTLKSWLLFGLGLGVVLSAAAQISWSQSGVVFNGPRDYLVGSYPESVVIGDFNGDGRPDIATANQSSNNISVLLQNSDGTFQPAVSYPVGNGPMSLQIGDVNGDGKLDLVVVNVTEGTMGVLLGNGDGTFQTQKLTTLSVSPFAYLVLGDFNADSKLDVALLAASPQVDTYTVEVMLGNGDGTFRTPVTYTLKGLPEALVAGDFNNDGKLDLATGGTTDVSVLLGNGDGTFQAAIQTAIQVRSFVVGDFNLDGKLDIATESGNLTLLLGNGDGTFQVNVLNSVFGAPLAAADLNGDGKLDLLARASNSQIEILLNNGDGTFTSGQSLPTASTSSNSVSIAAALSDLNGDQKVDLVIAASATHANAPYLSDIVSVLYGNGDGTFAVFPSYSPSPLGTLLATDFNGDGKPDLGAVIPNGGRGYPVEFGIYLNNGAGFAPATFTNLPDNSAPPPSYVSGGDFNGDGKVDVALTGSASLYNNLPGVSILLGNGDGTFQSDVQYAPNMSGPIAIADFNQDGKQDIIGIYSFPPLSPGISVLLGKGDGTFGFPVDSAVGIVSTFAVGDFNRDGKPDVAAVLRAQSSQQLAIFFGNGDGTFSSGPTYNVGFNPTAIVPGDMNGDGILDLVVGNSDGYNTNASNYTPSEVSVLLGNGDGTFQTPIMTTVGNGISSVAVADFNLDGKADVLVGNTGWNDVSLLLGKGDGTLQAPIQFYLGNAFGSGYDALAVADFDRNGSADVALAGANGISLLLNSFGKGGPAALLSPNALAFGSEAIGQTSSAQTAKLTYNNSSALNITSIAISGAQSADFGQANNCGASLNSGATCTITVTFSPQAMGARAATIQITDSASNSPQMISLTGTATPAPSIGLGTPSGGSSSATVAAGQSANYTLSIGGGGMSGTASLTCSGAPTASVCSVPATENFSATTSTTFSVTVTTTSRTAAAVRRPSIGSAPWVLATLLMGLVVLPWRQSRRTKQKQSTRFLYLLMLLILFTASCGGGGSSSPAGGTPMGSYALKITATSGSASQSVSVTLTVQ